MIMIYFIIILIFALIGRKIINNIKSQYIASQIIAITNLEERCTNSYNNIYSMHLQIRQIDLANGSTPVSGAIYGECEKARDKCQTLFEEMFEKCHKMRGAKISQSDLNTASDSCVVFSEQIAKYSETINIYAQQINFQGK